VLSIPIGWLVDYFAGNGRALKLIQAAGFFFLAASFFFLGPARLPFWETSWYNFVEPKVGFAVAAMLLKGIGSAGNNAGYSDMVIGLPDDDSYLNATVASLWNAAYALGWALGPLLGGVLYDLGGGCVLSLSLSSARMYESHIRTPSRAHLCLLLYFSSLSTFSGVLGPITTTRESRTAFASTPR
jgi:hypothetical protein